MKQIPNKLPLIIILLSAMFVLGLRLGIHCGKDIGYNQDGWIVAMNFKPQWTVSARIISWRETHTALNSIHSSRNTISHESLD